MSEIIISDRACRIAGLSIGLMYMLGTLAGLMGRTAEMAGAVAGLAVGAWWGAKR